MKINYNGKEVGKWYHNDAVIPKAYINDNMVFPRMPDSAPPTPVGCPYEIYTGSTISTYEGDNPQVYILDSKKWYMRTTLGNYKEYGVYADQLSNDAYVGELAIYDGHEYEYTASGWVDLGEVQSGGSLPVNVFSLNYNAKHMDGNTFLREEGQLVDADATINGSNYTINDGYVTIGNTNAGTTYCAVGGFQTYMNRNNSNPEITIISKAKTNPAYNNHYSLLCNRGSNYNWMWRPYRNKLCLHGGSGEIGNLSIPQGEVVIGSARVNSSRQLILNDWSNGTTNTTNSFSYGSLESGGFAMFRDYYNSTSEPWSGDFYWVFMCQSTLTDEEVQQVIQYNEEGGIEYIKEYDAKAAPTTAITVSTVEELESITCGLFEGMKAKVGNDNYKYTNGEWVLLNPCITGLTINQDSFNVTLNGETVEATVEPSSTPGMYVYSIIYADTITSFKNHIQNNSGIRTWVWTGLGDVSDNVELNMMFYYCSGLHTVVWPTNIVNMGDSMFFFSTSITGLTVNELDGRSVSMPLNTLSRSGVIKFDAYDCKASSFVVQGLEGDYLKQVRLPKNATILNVSNNQLRAILDTIEVHPENSVLRVDGKTLMNGNEIYRCVNGLTTFPVSYNSIKKGACLDIKPGADEITLPNISSVPESAYKFDISERPNLKLIIPSTNNMVFNGGGNFPNCYVDATNVHSQWFDTVYMNGSQYSTSKWKWLNNGEEVKEYTSNAIAIKGGVSECNSIEVLNFPNASATTATFFNDYNLRSVTYGSVESFVNMIAAYNSVNVLTKFKHFTFPSTTTTINVSNIFYNNTGMVDITVLAETPPYLRTSVFTQNSCPIYVPVGKLTAYQTASNWSALSSRLREIGDTPAYQATGLLDLNYNNVPRLFYSDENNTQREATIYFTDDGWGATFGYTPYGFNQGSDCRVYSMDLRLLTSVSSITQNVCAGYEAYLPSSVTNLSNKFFSYDYCTAHMTSMTPPALTRYSSSKKIAYIVPVGALSAYQTASNWSNETFIFEEGNDQFIRMETSDGKNPRLNDFGFYMIDGKWGYLTNGNIIGRTNNNVSNALSTNVTKFDASRATTVTTFGDCLFYEHKNTEIVFPPNLTTIRPDAFSKYEADELIIPEGVTEIMARGFSYAKIKHLTLPSSIVSLGAYCLNNTDTEYIVINATTPPTINYGTVTYYYGGNIYVPDASVNAYKTASNWDYVASKIKPISEKPVS